VLFRKEEGEMRRRLVEKDLVECVLGLGPNLFYNSPMEACVVVCRTRKAPARRGKVLFIDAVNEVTRERAQSSLTSDHQARIHAAFRAFADSEGFAGVASAADIEARGWSLSIPLYVRRKGISVAGDGKGKSLPPAWAAWEASGRPFWTELDAVVDMLDSRVAEDARGGRRE
jgi:type I restriction enzyme M protein